MIPSFPKNRYVLQRHAEKGNPAKGQVNPSKGDILSHKFQLNLSSKKEEETVDVQPDPELSAKADQLKFLQVLKKSLHQMSN